jgi:LPXTG-site transpeptidase (sortase) family protein
MHTKTYLILGTVSLTASFLIIASVFLPVSVAVESEVPQTIKSSSFTLNIPKLHLSVPILQNIDPTATAAYQQALTQGVAHAKGSALPGEGNTLIFGHSSDYLFNKNPYGRVFASLTDLEAGDTFSITTGDTELNYVVREVNVISATDWSFFNEVYTNTQHAFLVTCWPLFTDLNRLIVVGELQP